LAANRISKTVRAKDERKWRKRNLSAVSHT
jgi:hypothetical protein